MTIIQIIWLVLCVGPCVTFISILAWGLYTAYSAEKRMMRCLTDIGFVFKSKDQTFRYYKHPRYGLEAWIDLR